VGAPLQKTPSSALSLPCEIVSISQGRPLLAPEFTTSGQEKAGKGLKIPVCGGSSLHATPFRQKAAVHWMPMGREGSPPSPLLGRGALWLFAVPMSQTAYPCEPIPFPPLSEEGKGEETEARALIGPNGCHFFKKAQRADDQPKIACTPSVTQNACIGNARRGWYNV
jgi:hypothetical protein